MQELYNQIQAATNPLEIINLSDKFLDKQLIGYIKLMFLKGETLLSLGKVDDALSIFEQILEYDNNRFAGRAHNSIGFCYSIKNEFEKAESEFEKAREYSDESSLSLNSATLNLATLYSMTNKKENTFKIFKELYGLNPSNEKEDIHISLLTVASNPEELIMIYNSTIDDSYNADVNVLFAKGDALVNLQKFDDAINVFEEIPKYPYDKEVVGKAHNAMGFCYSRKNEIDKAICEFEKAYEYSKDPTILYNLASHYTMANQKEKSLEIFKELSELDPYNQDVKKIIGMLELELNRNNLNNNNSFNSVQEALKQADTYWEEKEFEKVIEVYDSINDFMPKQPLVWNRKGDAYYQLGRYEEAIKCFDKAFEYNPHSPFPPYYKSLIYMNLEDKQLLCYFE